MSEPRMSLPIRIGSIDTTTSSFRQFLSEFPFDEAEKIIASLPADEQNKVLQDVLLRKFVATFKKHHVNRVFRTIQALIKECDEEDESGWTEVYFERNFKDLCGDHEHLKPYHDYRYYETYGGGPQGGYITNDDKIFEVSRNWGEPFQIEKEHHGEIEIKEIDLVQQLRIVYHR